MRALLSGVAMFGMMAVVGCSSAPAATEGTDSADVTARTCTSRMKAAVLERARAISEDATVTSTKVLYGTDNAYADAVLVRVSDETEPSDYIVFRSRLNNGMVDEKACNVEGVAMLGEGVLPDDDLLVSGSIGAACAASLEKAVVAEAVKISEDAHVTDTLRLYGDSSVYVGGVVLLRVSDETEPSDYVATYRVESSAQEREGKCTVGAVKLVNSGVLPELPGLQPVSARQTP